MQVLIITIPKGRNGKDSGVALRGTKQRHTTVRGDGSAYKAAMKRTYLRVMKADYVLEEHGKVLAKWGDQFAQK